MEIKLELEVKEFQEWRRDKSPYGNSTTIKLVEVATYVMYLRKRFAKVLKETKDGRD